MEQPPKKSSKIVRSKEGRNIKSFLPGDLITRVAPRKILKDYCDPAFPEYDYDNTFRGARCQYDGIFNNCVRIVLYPNTADHENYNLVMPEWTEGWEYYEQPPIHKVTPKPKPVTQQSVQATLNKQLQLRMEKTLSTMSDIVIVVAIIMFMLMPQCKTEREMILLGMLSLMCFQIGITYKITTIINAWKK